MKFMQTIGILLLYLLIAGSFSPLPAVDEARQAYDRMVEEATREADDYIREKQNEKQAAAAEADVARDSALQERVQAERRRLDAEIDAVRGRGLSPTFTQGMKDNLLMQLQERLDRLSSDPEAYFGGP